MDGSRSQPPCPFCRAVAGHTKAEVTDRRPRAGKEGVQVPEASTTRAQQQFFPPDYGPMMPGYFFLFQTWDFSLETQLNRKG